MAARRRAVERVVAVLRERFADPLSLDDMADIAISSPFHFNRIFRQVTGVPPGRFLSAIRLQAAKQLLLTTERSVTDICFSVGYNSLGTFTTHFTMLVGTSPNRLRRLHGGAMDRELPYRIMERQRLASYAAGATVSGEVSVVDNSAGPSMIGVFRTPIPRGRPLACAMVNAPGGYRLHGLPDGRHYLLAVALETTSDETLRLTGDRLKRGYAGPVTIRGGVVHGPVNIVLREPRFTDPPILIALDVLLISESEES